MGGLIPNLYLDVAYKPVTIIKNQKIKCWMLLTKLGFNYYSGTFQQQKNAFLSATDTSKWPKKLKDITKDLAIRPFYIEGN